MPSRRLGTRVAMGVGGAVCLAGGIAMLLTGSSGLPGAVAVLAFGLVCLLAVPIMGAAQGEDARAPEPGRASFRGTSQPALLYTFSTRKLRIALAMMLLFSVGGLGMFLDGAVFVGLLVMVVFGGMSVIGLINVIGGTPPVALTPDGIVQDGPLGCASVAWSDVQEVFWWQVQGTSFLCIDAAGRVERSQRRWTKLLARANRGMGAGDFAIPAETLRQDPAALAERIERCAADPNVRRTLTTAG